jgi:hypothetical protein
MKPHLIKRDSVNNSARHLEEDELRKGEWIERDSGRGREK